MDPEDEEAEESSETTDESAEEAPEGAEGADGEENLDSSDPLRDALAREQARNEKLQKRVAELEDELEAARGDESEQLQELREENAELKAQMDNLREETRRQKVDRALLEEAQKAGATRPDAALRLVDRDEIEVTDDGEVAGATAELDRVEDEYGDDMPNLFGRGDTEEESSGEDTTDTSAPDSGSSKTSDRGGDEEPMTDEEVGAALFDRLEDDEQDQTTQI